MLTLEKKTQTHRLTHTHTPTHTSRTRDKVNSATVFSFLDSSLHVNDLMYVIDCIIITDPYNNILAFIFYLLT